MIIKLLLKEILVPVVIHFFSYLREWQRRQAEMNRQQKKSRVWWALAKLKCNQCVTEDDLYSTFKDSVRSKDELRQLLSELVQEGKIKFDSCFKVYRN